MNEEKNEELFLRSLTRGKMRLVCMKCGHRFTRSIDKIEKDPKKYGRCPKCGSLEVGYE